jgi:hypothetical protein
MHYRIAFDLGMLASNPATAGTIYRESRRASAFADRYRWSLKLWRNAKPLVRRYGNIIKMISKGEGRIAKG